MNKKFLIFGILAIVLLTASFFYFRNSQILTTNKSIPDINNQLRNNVIEIEKNLALTQFRRISFEEFKDNTKNYFQKYYVDSYFDERESLYNSGWLSGSTLPVSLYISNVYTSENEKNKYAFVRLSEENIANQAAFIYNFVIDNEAWKIASVRYYTLSKDMKMPENNAKKFTDFDGTLIKYELIKVLE